MKRDFSFLNSKIAEKLVHTRAIFGTIILIAVGISAGVVHWGIKKSERMCEGEACINISVVYAVPSDFIEGIDKKRYNWVEIYRQGEEKPLYRRDFNCQSKAEFSVRKGAYYLVTDGETSQKKEITVDRRKEVVLP